MQTRGAATKVFRGLVPHNRPRLPQPGQNVNGGLGRKTGRISAKCCSAPFLKTTIPDIENDAEKLKAAGILLSEENLKELADAVKHFCSFFEIEEELPQLTMKDLRKDYLTLYDFLSEQVERTGYYMGAMNMSKGISFCLYNHCSSMDYVVVILSVKPADHLSPKSADLFKEFIRYASWRLNVEIGINPDGDNYYLQNMLLLNEEEWSDLGEELDEEQQERVRLFKDYKEGGRYYQLFHEIAALPCPEPENLQERISKHIANDCNQDERRLMENLIRGIDVISRMGSVTWYSNRAGDEGFNDNDEDNYLFTSGLTAMLYDSEDDIAYSFMETINCCSEGEEFIAWNYPQMLTKDIKDEDLQEFVCADTYVKDFLKWSEDYHSLIEKY